MKINILTVALLATFLSIPGILHGADATGPRTSWQDGAAAAEKDLQQAGKEFTGAARQEVVTPVPAAPHSASPEAVAPPAPEQKNTKKPLSETRRRTTAATGRTQSSRDSALVGSPETGYAGTWTDPRNGDIITSVIAPTAPGQNTQSYPIIIEPQVNPSDWTSGNYGNSNWNTGWGTGYWPGGYGTPPPPPPGGMPPMWSGSPDIPSYPPPSAPGYRPLRPGNPIGWNPPGSNPGFQPGQMPPNAGMNPPNGGPMPLPPNGGMNPPNGGLMPPPPNGGMNPPNGGLMPLPPNGSMNPPNSGFQPGGMMPPPQSGSGAGGFQPSQSFRPLPMQPGGTTWHGRRQGGGPAPLFGRGGM